MRGSGALVVVGDALLDRDIDGRVERLSPDAPVPVVDDPVQSDRPGGAALAAALAAVDGRRVTLVSALADDAPGRELRAAIAESGVHLIDLGPRGATPEKVRVRAAGRTLLRLDHGGTGAGGAAAPVEPAGLEAAGRAIAEAAGVLVSDYGRGVAAEPALRTALEATAGRVPVVWDPHPRGATPVPGAALVTPNRREAVGFADHAGPDDGPGAAARARELRGRWRAHAVCVTLGAEGAVLVASGAEDTATVPAPRAEGGDPCGAGDRFASRAAELLAAGAATEEAVAAAVASASAFVAAGGAADAALRRLDVAAHRPPALVGDAPTAGLDAVEAVMERTRARGGTVVATGGCFDLLHAGHAATLAAARSLGDCLVVLLNSDASTRRLKGPGRPLVPEADRAALLAALEAVDAVALFDEDTPEALLERVRPDVWVKGGDYQVADLPEAALMERIGGRAVVLPYVPGRSTTRMIQEAVVRGAA